MADQPPTQPTDPTGDQPMTRPSFTLAEAADRCGVSRSTIKRRRAAGRFPNAWKDDTGTWRVPVGDLLADGLTVNRPTQGDDQEQTQASERGRDQGELDQLRGQLAVERARREAAEQLADERAERIADLRTALRALEASTGPRADAGVDRPGGAVSGGEGGRQGPATVPPAPGPARRTWRERWRERRGR